MSNNSQSRANNPKHLLLAVVFTAVAMFFLCQFFLNPFANVAITETVSGFCRTLANFWGVYVIGAMVGAYFGALIARKSGGDRRGWIMGSWLFPLMLLVLHVGFVVINVLDRF